MSNHVRLDVVGVLGFWALVMIPGSGWAALSLSLVGVVVSLVVLRRGTIPRR